MNLSFPRNKNWITSVACGMLSLIFLSITFLYNPPTPGYAPHMFRYNLAFFYPMVGLSFLAALFGFIFFAGIETKDKNSMFWIYKTIPFMFYVPVSYQVLWMVFLFVRIIIRTNFH